MAFVTAGTPGRANFWPRLSSNLRAGTLVSLGWVVLRARANALICRDRGPKVRSLEMKAIKSLLVSGLAATGMLAAVGAQAQSHGGGFHGGGVHSGTSHWNGGGHWGGGHPVFSGARGCVFIGAPLLFAPGDSGYPCASYYPRTAAGDRLARAPRDPHP